VAILAIQNLPQGTTREGIEAVSAIIMAGPPPAGCLSHAIIEDGGTFKSIDIWETQDQMIAFGSGPLTAAIVQVATGMGMDPSQLPKADPPQIFEAIDNFPR